MTRRAGVAALVASVLVIALPAAAGDVTGKWKITSKSPRGEREKVLAIAHGGGAQLEERLVDEGRGRERAARAARELAVGETLELAVDSREQLRRRAGALLRGHGNTLATDELPRKGAPGSRSRRPDRCFDPLRISWNPKGGLVSPRPRTRAAARS